MTTFVDSVRPQAVPAGDVSADLAGLDRAIRHLSHVAERLLDAGDARPRERQPVDVNDAVAQMQRVCQQIAGRRITVSCTLGATTPFVHANPVELEWILLNLVCNARDAMPEGGALVIDTATIATGPIGPLPTSLFPHQYVRLTVVDTGQGLDPALHDRVLDPWFTTRERGLGLGLTSVALTARSLHGWVHVKSNQPRGMQVQVYLPLLTDRA